MTTSHRLVLLLKLFYLAFFKQTIISWHLYKIQDIKIKNAFETAASVTLNIIAYNDGIRLLLKQPRWCSASQMFVSVGVPIRNLIYPYMCRMSVSENRIIQALAHIDFSSVRYASRLWRHWRSCLYITGEGCWPFINLYELYLIFIAICL